MKDRLEFLKAQIERLLREKEHVLIAIDGKCTSGKTTLAAQLGDLYDCNIFHMDDFFLRPEQRTAQRYNEVGGNVDYERFYDEVLLPLQSARAFSYRPFDCKNLALSEPISVSPKQLNIIEGSYSLHPYFCDPYHLKVLLTVDPETQRQRILKRPVFLQEAFFTKWIPLENRYFDALSERLTAPEQILILP